MTRALVVLCWVSLLIACGQPRIDGSSEDAFKSSMEAARSKLPEGERSEFDDAVRLIAFKDMSSLADLAALQSPSDAVKRMRDAMDGMTADEILDTAAEIREERRLEQLKQVQGEIREIEERLSNAAKAEAALAAFEVVRSRLERTEGMFSSLVVELTVKNGTTVPVSRAYFHGTLATPGRSVPWVSEDFNYSIPGGIEPGEQKTWRLTPSLGWGGAPDDLSDTVFTVTVERLDGPNGEPAFDRSGRERDRERLSELLSNLEDLNGTP